MQGSGVSVFGKRTIHGAFARIGQKKTGWMGVTPASLLGIASSPCIYGTIPIAAYIGVKNDDHMARYDPDEADPSLDPLRCVGCRACASICPQNITIPDIMRNLRHCWQSR